MGLEKIFISPTPEQEIRMKHSGILELLYLDFLKRYDEEFKHPPDLDRCKKIYNQIKNIEF